MPWVRFEDDYLFNGKVRGIGPYARLLDMSAIIYSARELRDGQLTAEEVRMIATLVRIPKWKPAADELVVHGRWELQPPLYLIHDYLAYQPSRETVLAERDRLHSVRAEAGRQGGLAKARKLANGVANGVANG
jgi:hypothetical protein